MIRSILFDLDGTFADTAPDLSRAVNRLRAERGLPPLPVEVTRRYTSSGARGMLGAGLNVKPEDPDYAALRERFLQLYEEDICVDSRLFEGIEALLAEIEGRELRWGIVTNKARRFTEPLMRQLDLHQRSACVVSGDTTPHAKPHPASLLHAASLLALPPADCLYIGDDLRDVQAARAAGMAVLAAAWGYLGDAGDPASWGADAVIDHPLDVLKSL